MPDQRIVPINHIKGSIRGKLQISRAKIQILRNKQIVPELRGKARILINYLVLLGSEETDVVINQDSVYNFDNEDSQVLYVAHHTDFNNTGDS